MLRSGDVMIDDDVTGWCAAEVVGSIVWIVDWSGLKLEPIELLFVLGTETLPVDVLA